MFQSREGGSRSNFDRKWVAAWYSMIQHERWVLIQIVYIATITLFFLSNFQHNLWITVAMINTSACSEEGKTVATWLVCWSWPNMKFNDLHIPGEQHQVPTRTEVIQHKHHVGKHVDCRYTTYYILHQYNTEHNYTTIYSCTTINTCMNNLHTKWKKNEELCKFHVQCFIRWVNYPHSAHTHTVYSIGTQWLHDLLCLLIWTSVCI